MSERHAINALIEKRRDILGSIYELEKQITAYEERLNHVDSTLGMFDVNVSCLPTQPRRVIRRRLQQFQPGELTRMLVAILRVAEQPMTAREITAALMQEKCIPRPDLHSELTISAEVKRVLVRLRLRHVVERIGERNSARWVVVDGAG